MNDTKILIVEDEYPIQELLKFNLERNNYLTTTIDSGNKVIDIAENENLDLILLDIMLPDINGLELCRLLKNNDATKHIPIILLTALSDEQTIVDGLEVGADDYITKPFSPNVLLARIKNCLKRYGGLYDKKSILPYFLKHGLGWIDVHCSLENFNTKNLKYEPYGNYNYIRDRILNNLGFRYHLKNLIPSLLKGIKRRIRKGK